MRVVLSGYYGFDNAGDEALLAAISGSLRTFSDSIEITVLSGNPARTTALHGVRAISRVNPFMLLKEFKQADLLISGGGSLLQDVTGPLSIPYYLGIAALAKLMGTPVVFYAQGIGPVNRRIGQRLIKLIADRVDLITLRDEDSAKCLKELGVKRVSIIVTADPVFSMRAAPDNEARGRKYLEDLGLGKEDSIIGVSLRPWNQFNDHHMAEFLDSLADMGHQILLLPLQFPEDLRQVKKIQSLMNKSAFIADKPMTSADLIGLISHLQLLVGMRLHSLIFAACAGIPFEGIAYDPKVESLLSLFEKRPIISGSIFNVDLAATAVSQTIKQGLQIAEDVREKAAGLKERSDATARLVFSVLENHQ
ncbi:MAG: polysaccharide pyruvyl transferase CsaB [Ignavibacteriales bacterium]